MNPKTDHSEGTLASQLTNASKRVALGRDDTTQETLAAIAESMDPSAVGELIGLHAVASIPDLSERNDKDLEQESVAAATSNVVAVLEGMVRGDPPASAGPPEVSVAWVSTLVHRGVSASVIPRCFVVGQALLDVALRDAVRAQDLPFDVKWDLAGRMSRYLFSYVEKVIGDLVEAYERERERWVRGADSVRTDLVLAIVEGRPFDPASASATLRYDLDSPHIAILVWADPRAAKPPPTPALREAATRLARELGGIAQLVLPAGQSSVWAWTTGAQVTDEPANPLTVDEGMFGALGTVALGPDGFKRSHHEAREARRLSGLLSHAPGSVVRYRSIVLSSLLTTDAAAAARFVEAELGAMSEDTAANRSLRGTLIVLFEETMSWGRAARRLGVHQNTVINRAHRAEELLGRPLNERRLELETALRLVDARDRLRAAGESPGS